MNAEVSFCGKLQFYVPEWSKITKDPRILSWISGYKIPFNCTPIQTNIPKNENFSNIECIKIDTCLQKLVTKGAIINCKPCEGQYLSKIFTVPKPNGDDRFILNLKGLNKFIQTEHFKLEDIRTVITLMTPNCYMATIDLQDAYFCVPIHNEHKKYLRFMWKSKIYEFQVLPFGLNTAPYVFTKLMKPVAQYLRSQGHVITLYLDDLINIGRSYSECQNSVQFIITVLTSLGFLINYEKSSLIPNKSVKFLGFILDSEKFHLSLPEDKISKIKTEVNYFLKISSCKIRSLSHLTGLLVAACPAVEYGWMYTKELERQKFLHLQINNDYESVMPVSNSVKEDLMWWLKNIEKPKNKIKCKQFQKEIFSDSSLTGWGASCENETASGLWNDEERKQHINFLELSAAYLALKTFCQDINNCEILIRIDNTTAVSYINRMGGIKYVHLNSITKKIWQWCEQKKIYLFASYIKSEDNVIADQESRRSHSEIECELNDIYFTKIIDTFASPEIDLFASRANTKCHRYASWKGDPDAYKIDAFTFSWSQYFFYAFPPFSLISKILQKIITEQSVGIVVVPKWEAQPWYPVFKKLACSKYLYLGPSTDLFKSYSSNQMFQDRLILVAAVLSGKRYHEEVSPEQLST